MSNDWQKEHQRRMKLKADRMSQQEEKLKMLLDKYPKLEIVIPFSCGGDSMYDIYTETNQSELGLSKDEISILDSILDELIYERVEFYECSDGVYVGEAGTVEVVRDEEGGVDWIKTSEEEYNEMVVLEKKVDLREKGFNDQEIAYLEEVVAGYLLNSWGESPLIYRKDTIMSQNQVDILTRFKEVLGDWEGFEEEAEEKGRENFNKTFEINDDQQAVCTDEDFSVSQSKTLNIENGILTYYYQTSGYYFVDSH